MTSVGPVTWKVIRTSSSPVHFNLHSWPGGDGLDGAGGSSFAHLASKSSQRVSRRGAPLCWGVVAKREVNREAIVDLDLHEEKSGGEVLMPGKATVALPRRISLP